MSGLTKSDRAMVARTRQVMHRLVGLDLGDKLTDNLLDTIEERRRTAKDHRS